MPIAYRWLKPVKLEGRLESGRLRFATPWRRKKFLNGIEWGEIKLKKSDVAAAEFKVGAPKFN